MSIWSLLLYISIPTALLLLLIILFCHGALQQLSDVTMLMVGRLIFARFNVLPFPLIQLVLGIHLLTAVVQGTSVYQWHSNHPPLGPNAPLDTLVNYNSKAWRGQRNLYLVCFSLVLWWMLYTVYSLKMQVDRATRALEASKIAKEKSK
jgi:hypothetical protein